MTNNEIRAIVQDIESGEVAQLSSHMDKFREAGFVSGEGVGNKNMTPPEIVRWYVGQGLDIEESGKLFAMNSWLNCIDKFVPADEGAQESAPGAVEDAKEDGQA